MNKKSERPSLKYENEEDMLLGENIEFEHGCKNIKKKILKLLNKGEIIDNYINE
jgi:hypothetical protein